MADALRDAREFLLTAYRTLPNVLTVTALLLGAAAGYLPLVYLGLGLLANATVLGLAQAVLGALFPRWLQVVTPTGSAACAPLPFSTWPAAGPPSAGAALRPAGPVLLAPSQWVGATVFFATFLLYDAARVMARPAAKGAAAARVDNRVAKTLGVIVVSGVFLLLVALRAASGCESALGFTLGGALSAGLAVGYWQLLDACHTGALPDVLGIVANSEPAGAAAAGDAPVVCAP
jgi:hypothetical protein